MPIAAFACATLLLLHEEPRLARWVARGPLGARLLRFLGAHEAAGASASAPPPHEQRAIRPEPHELDEDEDVRQERHRVAACLRGTGGHVPLVVRGLSKTYPAHGSSPSKNALERLDLIIERGECFGLLGSNGAGKSTTLSILTGVVLPSAGSALVEGHDVVHAQQHVYERLGYCPQTDPLLERLTARELLTLYARLRGVPSAAVSARVMRLLTQVGLRQYVDRRCGTFSGGNKRKLSLAIALLGSPALLLLDEPSCGLDPASRRRVWDVVLAARPLCSIILTSHAMEECEALCTRVGVMVHGRLRALGGLQHLKNKFGAAYVVELASRSYRGPALVEELRLLGGLFSRVRLVEDNGCRIKLALPLEHNGQNGQSDYRLADAFKGIEAISERLPGISEYAASQATLESVFLSIVRSVDQHADEQAELLQYAGGEGVSSIRGKLAAAVQSALAPDRTTFMHEPVPESEMELL